MKRFIGIDIIKTCAVFFVICVHFFMNTNYYSQPLTPGENLFAQTALRWFFLICVPLFLIATGYLQKNKTLNRKYYKGILPILSVYLLYSVVTIFIRHFHYGEEQNIVKWFFDVISFRAVPYAWYVNMFIGLFLLIPFLNLIFNSLNHKKEHMILIATLIFMCGIPSFINYMPIAVMDSNFLYFPDWWLGLYPLAYYYIGCYIRQYQPKVKKYLAILIMILSILVQTSLTYYFSHGGPFANVLGEYGSVMVMVTASMFFLIFYDVEFNNKPVAWGFKMISNLTLDIYLISFLADRVVYQYVLTHMFKSNYQIIYWFVPIIGTVIFLSVSVAICRKFLTIILMNMLGKKATKQKEVVG